MHNQVQAQSQPRVVWVDVLHFIAILMVIAIHCTYPFNASRDAWSNPEYSFWSSIYGSFLRPCIPLFVMITGLLLPIKQPMGDFYKKRLLRIVVPFLLWSVLYNLFPWVTGVLGLPSSTISSVFAYANANASQSFADALKGILLIPVQFNVYTVPMWCMYMLIGLYLFMPFFSAWVAKASIDQKKVFLAIWAVTLFMPYVYHIFSPSAFCDWSSSDTFYYFAGFNGYLLLGYFLFNDTKEWSTPKTLLICLPMLAIGCYATYLELKAMTVDLAFIEDEIKLFFLYCSPKVALMAAAIFLLVRKLRVSSPKMVNLFANITKCGLGIYLVHYFVVGLGYAIAELLSIPVSIRIPITAIVVFLISWGFVAAGFKLLPKQAKWIFG